MENSTFAPFRSGEGRDKGRAPSNSVELAFSHFFRRKVIEGMMVDKRGRTALGNERRRMEIHSKCFCRLLFNAREQPHCVGLL